MKGNIRVWVAISLGLMFLIQSGFRPTNALNSSLALELSFIVAGVLFLYLFIVGFTLENFIKFLTWSWGDNDD